MRIFRNIIIGLTLAIAVSSVSFAQENPGNPCGGENMKSTGDHNGIVFSVDDPMNRNSVTL